MKALMRYTSFPVMIATVLLAGAVAILFPSCSVTREVVRKESVKPRPVVVEGAVDWEDSMELRNGDEVLTDDGTGYFEVLASPPDRAPAGGAETAEKAKVRFRYRLKFEPKKAVTVSIDSARVETRALDKTVEIKDRTVVEKKLWKYITLILGGIAIALAAVLAILFRGKLGALK